MALPFLFLPSPLYKHSANLSDSSWQRYVDRRHIPGQQISFFMFFYCKMQYVVVNLCNFMRTGLKKLKYFNEAVKGKGGETSQVVFEIFLVNSAL
jgi:hypothetical protein